MLTDFDRSVVVAGDDPVTVMLLAEVLEGGGFRTQLAADGTALTERLRNGRPLTAIVLVAPLPGTSLPTALATAAVEWPMAARLVLLNADGVSSRISALDAGADAVLTLPVHPRELRAQLAALLRLSATTARAR